MKIHKNQAAASYAINQSLMNSKNLILAGVGGKNLCGKDSIIYQALEVADCRIDHISVFLLNKGSPYYTEYAHRLGFKLSKPYTEEQDMVIQELAEMARKYGRFRNIEVFLYDSIPVWRVIISDAKLFLSFYTDTAADGSRLRGNKLSMHEIDSENRRGFHNSFSRYYTIMKSLETTTPINLFSAKKVHINGKIWTDSKGENDNRPVARTSLFVSYCREDSDWLGRLQKHLRILERLHNISAWDDTKVGIGMDWDTELENALSCARVAILMVSPGYLSSEFISSNELPRLLAAAEDGGCKIMPIILKPCGFSMIPSISRFQSVNPPTKSLVELDEGAQERFFLSLVHAIMEEMAA